MAPPSGTTAFVGGAAAELVGRDTAVGSHLALAIAIILTTALTERDMKLSSIPPRAVTGGYILHSGLDKWNGDAEAAARTHGFAKGAYPFLAAIPPKGFLKLLAAGEVGLGAALLAPFVPDRLVGVALTGFSSALMGLYARTPGMRKAGSVWPSPQGTGLSKDVWMLGIGLGLTVDG